MSQKSRKPRPLGELLNSDSKLHHFSKMLNQQQALLKQIQGLLPSPLGKHCIHARISQQELIIHVDSSAWATRLRFHEPQLLSQLHRQAATLRRVKVLVYLPERRAFSSQKQNLISPQSADNIRATAASITDPELSDALHRLANKGKI